MKRPTRTYLVIAYALTACALALPLSAPAALAQQGVVQTGASNSTAPDRDKKRALSIGDYSRWRTIEGAQISADGKWVSYVLRLTNVPTADTKPELHVLNLDTNKDTVIQHASAPQFSPDSRWVVYQIEVPEPTRGAGNRGGGAGGPGGIVGPSGPPPGADSVADTSAAARARLANEPPRRRAELRELATGKTQHWADVATATFSPTSTHLFMRRRPPTPAGGPGAGGGSWSWRRCSAGRSTGGGLLGGWREFGCVIDARTRRLLARAFYR